MPELMICVIDYCYMNSLITYVFIEKIRSCNLIFDWHVLIVVILHMY